MHAIILACIRVAIAPKQNIRSLSNFGCFAACSRTDFFSGYTQKLTLLLMLDKIQPYSCTEMQFLSPLFPHTSD